MTQPKSVPNASSSDDLAQAKTLSHALHEAAPAAEAGAASPPYVSLAQLAKADQKPVLPPPPSGGPLLTHRMALEAPASDFGATTWNALLDACSHAVAASSAFLMTPQGLVIASRGRAAEHSDVLEAMGAHVMIAFEHADQLDPATFGEMLSLTLESAHGTVHSVRLRQADDSRLTLGLIIPTGLTAERQARLVRVLTANTPTRATAGPPP